VGSVQSTLAENREIVDDSVASGQLLHELRGGTEDSTAEMLRLSTCQESLGWDLAATAGGVDSVADDLHLDNNLLVVAGDSV
jgi:hypothetical protein